MRNEMLYLKYFEIFHGLNHSFQFYHLYKDFLTISGQEKSQYMIYYKVMFILFSDWFQVSMMMKTCNLINTCLSHLT